MCFVFLGKPSRSALHPDYVPFHFCYKSTRNRASARYSRAVKRSTVKRMSTATTRKNVVQHNDQGEVVQDKEERELTRERVECNKRETMQEGFYEQETVKDSLVEHDQREMMKESVECEEEGMIQDRLNEEEMVHNRLIEDNQKERIQQRVECDEGK